MESSGGSGAGLAVAAVGCGVSGNWQFELACGRQALSEIRSEWDAMADSLPGAGYLQRSGWYESYLSWIASSPDDFWLISARCDSVLRGVVAFVAVRKGRWPFAWLELSTVTQTHMNLADAAADPADLEFWPALLAWMNRQSMLRWDMLRIEALVGQSCFSEWIDSRPGQHVFSMQVASSAWIDCSRTLDHALGSVSRAHLTNLRRLRRRAGEHGSLRYEVVVDPALLDQALDRFIAVEASGWKGEEGSAIASDQRLVRFYRALVKHFGVRHCCRINLLWLDDTVIAAQFGLFSGRRLDLLKIGYSDHHKAFAPGNLIMSETIAHACSDPRIDRLGFCTHPPWSHLWKPQVSPIKEYLVFRDSLRGRCIRLQAKIWRKLRRTGAASAE